MIEPDRPFRILDYSLTPMTAGFSARSLPELRQAVAEVPAEALAYHLSGPRVRGDLRDLDYANDLADWVADRLHDPVLAERLALVAPDGDPERLRDRVLRLFDDRMGEAEGPRTAPEDAFHFVRPQIVLYDTGEAMADPADLPWMLEKITLTSLLLHFLPVEGLLDTRAPTVQAWLRARGDGHVVLADALDSVDGFLLPPEAVRARLNEITSRVLGGARPAGEARREP